MVTTKPISMANQFNSAINFGAAKSIATLTPIFTASHTKNPKPAVTALMEENWLINPRANNMAGITTAKAP